MIRKYTYQNQEYQSAWAVRQAIWEKEHKVFGVEPTEGETEFWASLGVVYIEEPDPEPTPEEIEAQELAKAKAERAEAVSKIIVEVDDMRFDGDETAQTRMGRTISAAMALGADLNTVKRTWVLADNTVAEPTIAQLAKALELAGNEQTRLWAIPYQSDSEEDTIAISSIGIV